MDFEIDFSKKRVLLLTFVVGIIGLSITADKCRQLVGEKASSKSGQFTVFNCLDGGSGTMACVVKEGVKLYFYNIRAAHVERARSKAFEKSLVDAVSQGMDAKKAAELAKKEGAKAAKVATRKAKRIIGPIISSGWDFFEAIYYGGTIAEGSCRGIGTLLGTYMVGYLGEQRFGRFGYLVGSELGSWVGGRVGLMVYDIFDGVWYLVHFIQTAENVVEAVENVVKEASNSENYETEVRKVAESRVLESDEASGDSYGYETAEVVEDGGEYESPSYDSSGTDDEF